MTETQKLKQKVLDIDKEISMLREKRQTIFDTIISIEAQQPHEKLPVKEYVKRRSDLLGELIDLAYKPDSS
jgi:hypothetical protein